MIVKVVMEGQVRPNRPVRTGILVAMFFLVACVAQSDSQQPQTRHNRMLQLLSRHRRVAQPSPQRGNAFKTLQEQEENKFKPVFRDCEKWNSEQHRPVVEEESRKGKTPFLFYPYLDTIHQSLLLLQFQNL